MIKSTNGFSSFGVRDADAARKFYAGTLGLDVREDSRLPGMFHLLIGSGATVMVYPKPDHEPADFTILNFPVGDIDATVAELKGKGVTFQRYDTDQIRTDDQDIARSDGRGPDIAWFTDPSGNVISVIGDPSIA